MAIGIQAIGEIGRRIWKIGFSVSYAPRTQPIHRPSGTATHTASPKPVPTRMSEAPMCRHSVPSSSSSSVPVTTPQGVGKITLLRGDDRDPPDGEQRGDDGQRRAGFP